MVFVVDETGAEAVRHIELGQFDRVAIGLD
jgi:hypothetical protein